MNPLLLTFADARLEEKYRSYRVDSFFDGSVAYPLAWFTLRTVMLVKTVMSPVLDWGRTLALLVFWLIPLMETYVRFRPAREWLRLHSLKLHFWESLLQGALAVLMCTTTHSLSPEQKNSPASLIFSSGLLIQLYNATWYCLPFKHYLVTSIWTAVLYVKFAIPSVCSGMLNNKSQQALVGLLSVSLNGATVCQDGSCFTDCHYPCKKLFLWHMVMSNLYFCYLTWQSEKKSRKDFVDKLSDQPPAFVIHSSGCNTVSGDYLSSFLCILYMSWHLISFIY